MIKEIQLDFYVLQQRDHVVAMRQMSVCLSVFQRHGLWQNRKKFCTSYLHCND